MSLGEEPFVEGVVGVGLRPAVVAHALVFGLFRSAAGGADRVDHLPRTDLSLSQFASLLDFIEGMKLQ